VAGGAKCEFCKKCHLWDVWKNVKRVAGEIKRKKKEWLVCSAFIAIIMTKDSKHHMIVLAQDYLM
jgi:hypothetical protein